MPHEEFFKRVWRTSFYKTIRAWPPQRRCINIGATPGLILSDRKKVFFLPKNRRTKQGKRFRALKDYTCNVMDFMLQYQYELDLGLLHSLCTSCISPNQCIWSQCHKQILAYLWWNKAHGLGVKNHMTCVNQSDSIIPALLCASPQQFDLETFMIIVFI